MSVKIIVGDVREVLKTLQSDSIHCCVSSPPYWGLRDYGVDGQIGLESSPSEFITTMVAVFEEVRRVLRPDGTCFINMGDSYATGTSAQDAVARNGNPFNLAAKQLVMMPHRLAIALQDSGWWVRQDIVWSKKNPMPESVRDRCTKSHEYIFLLTKSERYYFDADAIAEPSISARGPGNINPPKGQAAYEGGDEMHRTKSGLAAYADRQRSKRDSFKRDGSKREQAIPGQSVGTHRMNRDESEYDTETRNKRSVWTIATRSFKEAHFATFPPEIPETCIKAGCPVGGIVLDPFFGAGTTGLVADRLQRNCIGIELNEAYAEIARKRIQGDSTLFCQVEVTA